MPTIPGAQAHYLCTVEPQSNSGHSEIRTASLQRTQLEVPVVLLYLLNLPNKATSLQRTKEAVLSVLYLEILLFLLDVTVVANAVHKYRIRITVLR